MGPLTDSLPWLNSCYRLGRLCLEDLDYILRNVWGLESYICRMLANHGIINGSYLSIWRDVMILKGDVIIIWSPIHYIYGIVKGIKPQSPTDVLIGDLDKISILLGIIKDHTKFIKTKMGINMSVVGSYVKNISEQLGSIKSSIRYLVFYMEPMGNILRYMKRKIDSEDCLSININDLEWEQKYLKCSRSVKIAISSLKYLHIYVDNSFHTIELIDSSVKIVKQNISILKGITKEMVSLIYRAVNIRIRLEETCRAIEQLRMIYDDFFNFLDGTIIIKYGSERLVYISIKDQIETIQGIIKAYMAVCGLLISGIIRVYYFNMNRIKHLEECASFIEYTIRRIRKVIDGFDISKKQNIKNLELWFKYILKQFTGSSLRSTIKNLKDSKNITASTGNTLLSDSIKTNSQYKYIPLQTKNHGDIVWGMLSHMSMMEPEIVLVKLYECHEKKEKIDEILKEARCYCATYFNCLDKPNCMKEMWSHQIITKTLYESKKDDIIKDDQNRMCICLVITYHVYPKFVKWYSLVLGIIRNLSSCSSRNFDKRNNSHTFDFHRSKLALFLIQLIGNLVVLIKERYLTLFLINPYGSFHCYCISPDAKQHLYFICIMIYICSLLENTPESDDRIEFNIPQIIHLLQDLEDNDIIIGKKSPYHESQTVIISQNREKNKAKPSVKIEFEPFKSGRRYYYMTTGTRYSNQTNLTLEKLDQTNELRITHKLRLSIRYDVVQREHFGVTVSFPFTDKEKVCEKIKGFSSSLCSGSVGTSGTSSNGCTCKRCQGCVILKPTLNLFYKNRESTLMQISDNSILSFLVELEYRFAELKTLYYVIEKIVNDCKTITIMSRNNRIVDSTSEINNKFEGGINNHYSYNDAYRINTSRAHGSLKYIIIKLVLILIIVVMTIFIRVKIEVDYIKEGVKIYKIMNSVASR